MLPSQSWLETSDAWDDGASCVPQIVGQACPAVMALYPWKLERFVCVARLGRGISSTVHRVWDRWTGLECALKIYDGRAMGERMGLAARVSTLALTRMLRPLSFFSPRFPQRRGSGGTWSTRSLPTAPRPTPTSW